MNLKFPWMFESYSFQNLPGKPPWVSSPARADCRLQRNFLISTWLSNAKFENSSSLKI
jgi:hypothetical protein